MMGEQGNIRNKNRREKIKKKQSYLYMCGGTLLLLCISNDVFNSGVELEPRTQELHYYASRLNLENKNL
jgi:hypothetical protein